MQMAFRIFRRKLCPLTLHLILLLISPYKSKKRVLFPSTQFCFETSLKLVPGMFVTYDISPLMVEVIEHRRSFTHFLTGVCAIVGGVFTGKWAAISIFNCPCLYHTCHCVPTSLKKYLLYMQGAKSVMYAKWCARCQQLVARIHSINSLHFYWHVIYIEMSAT